MTQPLRAAVIGLGVGERHAAAYAAHPGCELVALCDFDSDTLARVGAAYPSAALSASATDILDDPDIDLVSIATWDDQHAAQILRALERGKHVFAEKPLCLFREEAVAIRRALDLHPGQRLSSNLILRCSPRFRWLREQVGCGRLGDLFYAEGDYRYGRIHKLTDGWRGKLPWYSVILGGAVHLVDLLLWITGDRVVEVDAFGNRIATQDTGFRHQDLVAGLLRFESGMVGKVTANMACVHPHYHGLELYGTRATFRNGVPDGTLIANRDGTGAVSVDAPYPGVDKGELAHEFVSALLDQRDPPVTEGDVFDILAVCLALDEAASGDRRVPVTYF